MQQLGGAMSRLRRKDAMSKPSVIADDRALAALLLETLRPDAAKDKQSLETVAKVLSTLHDRAVACASVRVERERRADEREGPVWYLKNEKGEYLSRHQGWVADRLMAEHRTRPEIAHCDLLFYRRAAKDEDRMKIRLVRVRLRVRT
jgi:hypothetical protein